jgi:protein-S-isoprenylcysteine O-methyltransferase Ste14
MRLESCAAQGAAMSRVGIFIYGLLGYAVFLAVFAYGLGFIGGLVTPTMLDGAPRRSWEMALAIDLGLLTLFALQHSGMARPAFRRWWTRIVPQAAERSTYVLASSLVLAVLFLYWEPIGGVVWQASSVGLHTVVVTWYFCGWLLVLYATLLIDHFDLFGLTQVWRHLAGRPYRASQFNTAALYPMVRQPLYVGWLTVFWAAPTMTVAHLVFALLTTAYILISIRLEERNLVSGFGDLYIEYREHAPMLIPPLPPRQPPAVAKGAGA